MAGSLVIICLNALENLWNWGPNASALVPVNHLPCKLVHNGQQADGSLQGLWVALDTILVFHKPDSCAPSLIFDKWLEIIRIELFPFSSFRFQAWQIWTQPSQCFGVLSKSRSTKNFPLFLFFTSLFNLLL
jgi:hypothetical protein